MFFVTRFLKKFRTARMIQENGRILFIFLVFSLLFAAYMVSIEGLGLLDTYYFLVTTATTVGYGDISPTTPLGKVLVTIYMVVGIALLGLFIGKVTDLMVDLSSRRKKGLLKVKSHVDLMIIGYPGDDKVQHIVAELRADERMQDAVIVCLNNCLSEKPAWMHSTNVQYVAGVASDSTVLKRAGIESTTTALILANNPNDITSDDLSTSVCAVIERMNPAVRTVVEKVRADELIFQIVNADTIVDVASASVLAREVLDSGAIELQNAIFSTQEIGTQFNCAYVGEQTTWAAVASEILDKDAIPEGFKNPGEPKFNLMPMKTDVIKPDALVKYRGIKLFEKISIS